MLELNSTAAATGTEGFVIRLNVGRFPGEHDRIAANAHQIHLLCMKLNRIYDFCSCLG